MPARVPSQKMSQNLWAPNHKIPSLPQNAQRQLAGVRVRPHESDYRNRCKQLTTVWSAMRECVVLASLNTGSRVPGLD